VAEAACVMAVCAATASTHEAAAVAWERAMTSIKEVEDWATQAERGGGVGDYRLAGFYSWGG
jgi:hypothetical protein